MSITTANGITTDDFTTNTAASYTSDHTDGGTNGSQTFDTANKRLLITGGNDTAFYYNGLTLFNSFAEVDMDQSDGGGVQVMRSSTALSYNLYIKDSQATTNPNTFILYSLPNYTVLAQGSISFTRGTKHTIRLEVVRYDLVIYFDGQVIAIAGSSDVQTSGKCGMLGGGSATQHYLRFAVGDFDNLIKPAPPHYPTDGHAIYDYGTYMSSPTLYKARLDTFAAAGFKLVMNYSLIYDTTAHMLDYINYAASLGMKVVVSLKDPFLWLSPAIQANIPIMYAESGNKSTDATFTPYVVNAVKSLAGVWGYYVGDEVAFSNKAALQTHISVIAGADNAHPTLQIQSDLSSSVHRLTTDWTGCASVIGDDVYPYPDVPHPSVEEVAYGIGKYCAFHGAIQQAIALQCYAKDGINNPTQAMMSGWITSVLAYMQPRVILWFAYPDLLTSPNSSQLWSDLTAAIAANMYHPPSNVILRARSGAVILRAREL